VFTQSLRNLINHSLINENNKCGITKKPAPRPDLNHRPPGYRPGATLGGQTWRDQGKFY